jgi:hypothetical protein
MYKCAQITLGTTIAVLCFLQPTAQSLGQELSAEAKSKDVAEARAKRNAQNFQNNASVLTILDRYGQRTAQIGGRAMYDVVMMSPDGKRIATIKEDLDNESADLWVADVAARGWLTSQFAKGKRQSIYDRRTAKESRNSFTRIPAPS